MELKLNNSNFEEINIGDEFSFEHTLTEQAVNQFSELSGDKNPLHVDEEYAKTTQFGGRIAHGMLVGSLFSALVGMLCPGRRCLYLSQNLRFRKPVRLNEKVRVFGRVVSKSDATQVLSLETVIKNFKAEVVVDGAAQVRVI